MSFKIIENVISEEQENELIEIINSLSWNKDLTRYTQQYGYKYTYNSRNVVKLDGEIPDFLIKIRDVIYKDADQILINRYLPGEGIACHQDSTLFEDKVMSLSLGSNCMFKVDGGEVYLKRRSLFIMYKRIFHGIDKRKTDYVNEKQVPRDVRISITFRKVRR